MRDESCVLGVPGIRVCGSKGTVSTTKEVEVKRSFSIVLALVLGWTTTGCATIVHGNRQTVTINSEPDGATVKIDGLKGKTPFSASLARNNDYVVSIKKKGYKEEQVQITKSFSGLSIIGNILWLLVGVIMDFASGSAYNLSPTKVEVELEKADTDNADTDETSPATE